jgi:hypothetical protein
MDPLQLTVLSGGPGLRGRTFALAPGRIYHVGREGGAEIGLPDPHLSRRNCQVRVTAQGAWVRDLSLFTGTTRNCLPVRRDAEEPLLPGDVLGVCRDWLRLGPAVEIDPGWLRWNGGALARLVQRVGEGRGDVALPVLADALEEAGCTDAGLLRHCRSGTSHIRTCWVVSLLREHLPEVP